MWKSITKSAMCNGWSANNSTIRGKEQMFFSMKAFMWVTDFVVWKFVTEIFQCRNVELLYIRTHTHTPEFLRDYRLYSTFKRLIYDFSVHRLKALVAFHLPCKLQFL